MCEKCSSSHSKKGATRFHNIYHFDTLAERMTPMVTGGTKSFTSYSRIFTNSSIFLGLTQPTGTAETTPTNQNPPNSESQSSTNEESVASTSTITAHNAINHANSRVVGAERRSSGESSRNSSRTSSLTLPSPSTSNEESLASTSTIPAQNAFNYASSRVVGAERRPSDENSRNSSRTSFLTAPSLSSSRSESFEALSSAQPAVSIL